jgi:hypothetical protein
MAAGRCANLPESRARARSRANLHGTFALPFLLASLPSSCARRAPPTSADPHARCATLDAPACERARALTAAARTYADEVHELVLASPSVASSSALARTPEGLRPLPLACARVRTPPPRLDLSATSYAFVGVAVDATLVSADADVGPLLARKEPPVHDVRLVALALVRDTSIPTFDRGEALLETASGACTCGDATDFASAPRYGAMVSFAFDVPPRSSKVRAIDLVRAALDDPHVSVRETRVGRMTIDGLARFAAHDVTAPLDFHVTDPAPVAFAVSPLSELCDFPAPEVSPSPLDFGIAPYGSEARRTVHVVNRSTLDLRALLGASTYLLPARGAIDLPLRWTPEGDAPGCETQTRDLAIPFFRMQGGTPHPVRVLETIRTGRATVQRVERVEPSAPKLDLASTVREWTCPRDFTRLSCRSANVNVVGSATVEAQPKGKDMCHFACQGPAGPAPMPLCRFDAEMTCALNCPP